MRSPKPWRLQAGRWAPRFEAYGVTGDHAWRRLAVHEVLHAFEERSWIAYDRPEGWQRSIARLDDYIDART